MKELALGTSYFPSMLGRQGAGERSLGTTLSFVWAPTTFLKCGGRMTRLSGAGQNDSSLVLGFQLDVHWMMSWLHVSDDCIGDMAGDWATKINFLPKGFIH